MELDLARVPFSRFGSYLVISFVDDEGRRRICLRDVGGGDEDPGILLDIVPTGPMDIRADETHLLMSSTDGKGTLDICMPEADTVLLHASSLEFSLDFAVEKYDHLNPLAEGEWEFHSYTQEVKLGVRLIRGTVAEHIHWETAGNTEAELVFAGDSVDVCLRRYIQVPEEHWGTERFSDALRRIREDYLNYGKGVPRCSESRYDSAVDIATYITWSSFVGPSGQIKRPAMYMSNNWMTNIWSWDHCFNAIGLATHRPELAWDQFIFFKDFQSPSGVLPDYANDRYISFACCKPPIHGWAYTRLLELNPYFTASDKLETTYTMLTAMEGYWRKHRTQGRNSLPFYNHGNDSGWDNATVFAGGCPLFSPDLPAYLVLLYETLQDIAVRLNRLNDARVWKERGEKMLRLLIEELWDGKRFRSRHLRTNALVTAGDSLIDRMPIVIGHRLPESIRVALVEDLAAGPLRTEYGLATESTDSPFYRSDGYWRGPIWAPVTMLIADGLRRSNEEAAARELARDFCDTTLIGGMAENFDAQTGKGLADPAFTWTSSVFLHSVDRFIR